MRTGGVIPPQTTGYLSDIVAIPHESLCFFSPDVLLIVSLIIIFVYLGELPFQDWIEVKHAGIHTDSLKLRYVKLSLEGVNSLRTRTCSLNRDACKLDAEGWSSLT